MRRRRRDREGGRGRPLAPTVIAHQANELDPPSRSELAPKVLTHPGPPSLWIPGRTHSLRSGPDVFSQPLTTSLGTSASHLCLRRGPLGLAVRAPRGDDVAERAEAEDRHQRDEAER